MTKPKAERVQEEIKKYIAKTFYEMEQTATGGNVYRDPFNHDICMSIDECYERIFITKRYGIPREKKQRTEFSEEDVVSLSG